MEDEKWLEDGQKIYRFLTDLFDRNEIPYEGHPKELTIVSMTEKDGLDIPFSLAVNPYNYMVSFMSPLAFDVPEDVQVEMSVAVCEVNKPLMNGCFKYSPEMGRIVFYLYNHYIDSPLSEEEIFYMLGWSFGAIGKYHDPFQDLASGEISLEEFMNITGGGTEK